MKVEQVNLNYVSNHPWFDDPVQIHNAIRERGLEGLNQIAQLRSDYGHKVKTASMREFIVAGMWSLSYSGSCMRLSLREFEGTPPRVREIWDKIKYAETVHTPEEFNNFFYNLADEPQWQWERTLGGLAVLPPADIPCDHCGKTWSIGTSHDCRIVTYNHMDDFEYPADSNVIGKTLAEVRELIQRTPDGRAELKMYMTTVLRSDRFIDLTPTEARGGEPQVRNRKGYATGHKQYADRSELVDWNRYVVREDDVLIFAARRYIHPTCMVDRATATERKRMVEAIEAAGVDVRGSVVVPNNYSERGYAADWFIFDTDKGMFRVGWRRRVISVLKVQHGQCTYDDNQFVKVPGTEDQHFDRYVDMTEHFKSL
jgi:hypothetical protein